MSRCYHGYQRPDLVEGNTLANVSRSLCALTFLVLSFLSAFSMISPHVRPQRHLLGAAAYRQEMRARLPTGQEVTQTEVVG